MHRKIVATKTVFVRFLGC